MEPLDNPIRRHAWGSRTVIAELRGRPTPSPTPEAEMWLGAHPGDPSLLVAADGRTRSLLDEVDEDPVGRLGAHGAHRWDGRLPFLLKVLAADRPLSLQVHPGEADARAGFDRENAAGIPIDAPHRNYRDANHKPELICALTEFHALSGFRPPAESLALLRALGLTELARRLAPAAERPGPARLRAVAADWLTMPRDRLDRLVPELREACAGLLGRCGPGATFRAEAATLLELADRYPGDPGVLAAALLNRVTLAPGEALYQGRGVPHAHLSGACIEVMASSDNVLRGGLTGKHVDVPELLRVLDFRAGPAHVLRGRTDGAATRFDTPAEEFRLWRLDWRRASTPAPLPVGGPRIALCTEGTVRIAAEAGRVTVLRRGDSVWLDAGDRSVTAAADGGPARLFLAADGTEPVRERAEALVPASRRGHTTDAARHILT
ncbi:MAG TPA: mannose-6-phosphate isomerase, class I [Pseudonocardia sp.]|jgi:mannose-6-phosphate isomerase